MDTNQTVPTTDEPVAGSTAAPDAPRIQGFGKSNRSANQAYRAYLASAVDNLPMDFTTWLTKQQAAGNFLKGDTKTIGGWRKHTADQVAPAQPNITQPSATTSQTAATQTVNKTDTAAKPWRPLGMHPLLLLAIVGGTVYLLSNMGGSATEK